jgi:hypothetical protein
MMWAVNLGLPVRPAGLALCWEPKPDAPARCCTRAPGHDGNHHHEYSGATWPSEARKPRA